MQYMSGVTDTQVKWTLEYRSDNPGIRDGDMFLANDPWVGAAHQQDVMLICPVFWKGELFCWVTNCLHQYDIGGITPGSLLPVGARRLRRRHLHPAGEDHRGERDPPRHRGAVPALLAQARARWRSTSAPSSPATSPRATACLRSSSATAPEVVKGVMRKILDNGERAFLEKLRRLPDGVWRERTYVECCRPGDRRTHRVMLTLRKKGNKLDLRERRHRAAGRRDERHLLGLARRDHGGAEPAAVLGPVLLDRRRAAPRRVQSDAGHASTAPTSRPRSRPRRCRRWRSRSTRPTTCSRR